jgi:hypothetical protein
MQTVPRRTPLRPAILLLLLTAAALTGCGVVSLSLSPPRKDAPLPRTAVAGPAGPDSIRVIAEPDFAAGALHRFFFGDHYRTEWTSPFTVPVLRLDTLAGGLRPLRKGGGYQTRTLRLRGADGREFAFRSTAKDPGRALPPEIRGTFVADVLRDQISSSHPAGALVVHAFAEALGVLQARPLLAYMPDDSLLGDFRQEFAGILGILEEYPAESEGATPSFTGTGKVVGTLNLFGRLDDDSRDRVDAQAFLTARLLDIFVGDWDRHIDQWRWVRRSTPAGDRWLPVPRDRDQAFARLDGLLPALSTEAITQLESFGEEYPKIDDLTFSGRFLDRRLLPDLDRPTWDSISSAVTERLTDALIDSALARIPGGLTAGVDRLRSSLRSRRNALPAAASAFHTSLAGAVDVRLSEKRERVTAHRLPGGGLELRVVRVLKEGEPLQVFRRIFSAGDTDEVRVYLLGGDDAVEVSGSGQECIILRVIGGKGDDRFTDAAHTACGTVTFFYDHQGSNSFSTGPRTCVDESPFESTMLASEQY